MLLPAVAAAWVPMPNAKQAARRSTRVIDIVLLVAGFRGGVCEDATDQRLRCWGAVSSTPVHEFGLDAAYNVKCIAR